MTKRLMTILLIMAILTTMLLPVSALADSWICPNCGVENQYNFCMNCGAARPAETPKPDDGSDTPAISLFPWLFPGASTEEPITQQTPVPVTPMPERTPGGNPVLPWFMMATATPEPVIDATAIPTAVPTAEPTAEPTPEPTQQPAEVPTPVPQPGQWINRFSTANTVGKLNVTISPFADTHPGQYYIYICYAANDYYNWYALEEGQTVWGTDVIPGEEVLLGVYWDPAGTGRPAFDASAMKTIKLMDADVYKDHGFYETDHGICVEDNGTLIDISAFSASDITDPEINAYAYFQWHYDFSKSTEFPVVAVLRSPSGNLYLESSSFTFEAADSVQYYRYLLDSILSDCNQNEGLPLGEYQFELYRLGKLASRVPFSIETERQLAAVPTMAPTAVPTIKPTKAPTPEPTKAPTPKPRTFKIQKPTMSRGITTISWEDSENRAPYTVFVQHEAAGSGTTELGAPQIVGNNVNTRSISNGYVLVPGEPYTITVRDVDGKTATYSYHPTKKTFADFKVTSDMELRVTTLKGTRNGNKSFKASEIEKNISDYDFFAYLKLSYPPIRYARTANWTGAVTIPNGDVFLTSFNEDTTISADSKQKKIFMYWKHYTFNDVFRYLMETEGYIPTGKYTWTLYFDGEKASSTTFNVTK